MITDEQLDLLYDKHSNKYGEQSIPEWYAFCRELIALAQQVKPLEFFIGDDGRATAETPFGTYRVNHTLDEAIAVANEDYQRRVLQCLVHGGV